MAVEGVISGAAVAPAMITPESEHKQLQTETERTPSGEARSEEKKGRSEAKPPPKVDEKYIERVRKALDLSNVGREYKIYDKLGKLYIRVYNKDSGELIREIPPEDITELTKSLQELTGVLLNYKV